MKKMPLGIQSFRKIIEGDYVYVDKTDYVYDLINNASYYFLSRPRRFGKSLFLDTIAEVFSGDKRLFKGLFIYDSGYKFEKHPVLRVDMSNIANDTPDILKEELMLELMRYARDEGINIDYSTPSSLFKAMIKELHDKYDQRVVVLIDEYDKPILDWLDNAETAEANREVLRGFYGVLKSMDPYLRLTFITGVSKFSKTSIFSELNNLYDITLVEEYADICGITTKELSSNFGDYIEWLSSLDTSGYSSNLHNEIMYWYGGYSWDGRNGVINPHSLLSFFARRGFSSFWHSSGTPRFLLDLIKNRPKGYTDLKRLEMGEWSLDSFDIQNMDVEPLLFQTGYLTVKEVRPEPAPAAYILGIPNNEVRMAFDLHILADFTESGTTTAETAYRKIKESLISGDLKSMLNTLRALFSAIPDKLSIGRDAYYHSIFQALLSLLGFEVKAEISGAGVVVDAVLELKDKVYVMELRYRDTTPYATPDRVRRLFEEGLIKGMRQLRGKGYHRKYAGGGKTIHLAVFTFLGSSAIEIRSRRIKPGNKVADLFKKLKLLIRSLSDSSRKDE